MEVCRVVDCGGLLVPAVGAEPVKMFDGWHIKVVCVKCQHEFVISCDEKGNF
jgi:hypothetical protein